MSREVVEPEVDEYGAETHPAFGSIGASRVQSTGTVLFDSDVRHQHYVVVHFSTAKRTRDLKHDHIYPDRQMVEVAMSEAQWASFVSSMNVGAGVPCTITARPGEPNVPGMPYAPRLAESMDEVRGAAHEALAAVREAFSAYKAHKTAANLRDLEIRLQNAEPNISFAATSLNEHAENVVQKARADIEAMVVAKARQLGLDPGDLGGIHELTEGTS